MNEYDDFDETEEQAEAEQPAVVRPRAVGTSLSAGMSQRVPPSSAEERARPVEAPQSAHASEEPAETAEFPGIQRAANFVRAAVPILQRLLPLIDGNVATAIGNLLASRSHPQSARSGKGIDLAPLEESLAELRSQQHSLRMEATEQNISLKRLEDQLETLRAITSRNLLEQQESFEDMKALGSRMKWIAVIAVLMAAASLAMTLVLFLRFKKGLL